MTEPKATYDVIDTKDILSRMTLHNNVIGTHYDGCWQYHPECLIVRLCNEIDQLRQERTMLLLQRDEMLKRIGENDDTL